MRTTREKFSSTVPQCVSMIELKVEDGEYEVNNLSICCFQEHLSQFLLTCETSIGPKASLKMLVSSTGNMMTTSSSSRLWQLVQFDSVLVEFILAATKSLPDYRLQSAALATRLLLEETDNIDLQSVMVNTMQYNAIQCNTM